MLRRTATLALVAALSLGVEAAAEPIQISFEPVSLREDAPTENRLGALTFRGGFALSSKDRSFGGWSDLRLTPEGDHAILLSDRGHWLRLGLLQDENGMLTGIKDAETGPLITKEGEALPRFFDDSEGLIAASDGGWVVSFENNHRLWHYPKAEPPFSAPPRDVPTPPGLNYAPRNEGIEALVALADGRLLAITEGLRETGGGNIGWIGGMNGFAPLTYMAAPGFNPTSACLLPDGDLVVLERRFSIIGGFAARLTRVSGKTLAPGARLEGVEIARFDPTMLVDNFEGIEARSGPSGETLLYLLSDDNFSMFQRTLLLVFALTEP